MIFISICPSVHPPTRPLIHQSTHASTHPQLIHPQIHTYTHIHPSIQPCINICIHPTSIKTSPFSMLPPAAATLPSSTPATTTTCGWTSLPALVSTAATGLKAPSGDPSFVALLPFGASIAGRRLATVSAIKGTEVSFTPL